MTVLPPGKLCGHALQGLHNKPKLEERWHLRLGGYLEVMDGFPPPGTRNSPPQRGEETPRRLPAEQAAAWQVWGCSTGQMQKVFGKEVLDYSLNLGQGKLDLLVRMPDNIILQIFSFLDMDDIEQLSKTCKKFQKMCSNEEFWEKFGALQDKHPFDAKKIGITTYKKLLALHQNAAQQKLTQRRQTAFY
ncbi:F-box only protein 36-like isoform X3 [Pteropus vampyrus]|uniref:F-box only protein 36-like isoform X3 n=1 Tax=Pteropus vampyrus TaxID=132908 RepID=A0A6P3RSA4_PTEVA|nr:F-box only protein 36-like isoform X3 [Pteropus vampyrus]XP_011385700.1 F-box only protein 36-like isoform X3 [Pteropus vampyrus]XP_011385701.1 F-box only protein 36-like isoform X3 [Pteropus vampyrus]XP_023382857.1 F-box only protein 36-like isoform X3 [Pteropus vampyrus]XP_023382858.1 F-box only protein 36-like isoform X3 [Pteropus vampyrus]